MMSPEEMKIFHLMYKKIVRMEEDMEMLAKLVDAMIPPDEAS